MPRPIAAENLKIYARTSTRLMLLALWGAALLAVAGDRYLAPAALGFWPAVLAQSWITLFVQVCAVIVAGGIVANEYQWGTIKLLLIRPVRRGRILLAKYLAVLLFIALSLALLFLALAFLNLLLILLGKGGAGGPGGPGAVGAYYLLRLIDILVYASIAFMLSAAARSNALAVGTTLLAMVFGPESASYLGRGAIGKYYLFSQTGLARFLAAPRPEGGLGFALAVIGAYLAVFYAAAWWALVKRDVLE